MAYWRTLKGGRPWFGTKESKAAAKRARRQADREAIDEAFTPSRAFPSEDEMDAKDLGVDGLPAERWGVVEG